MNCHMVSVCICHDMMAHLLPVEEDMIRLFSLLLIFFPANPISYTHTLTLTLLVILWISLMPTLVYLSVQLVVILVYRKLESHLFVSTGGGVTVKYAHHLMNLLTVRRARPRLLVEGPKGTTFHPDVAEVIAFNLIKFGVYFLMCNLYIFF